MDEGLRNRQFCRNGARTAARSPVIVVGERRALRDVDRPLVAGGPAVGERLEQPVGDRRVDLAGDLAHRVEHPFVEPQLAQVAKTWKLQDLACISGFALFGRAERITAA